MRKIALCLAVAMVLITPPAFAVTKKATPTPTTKASTKPSAKSSSLPSAKPTAKSSALPTAKPTLKPKPKPRPRKKISLSPSPSAYWPPAGFKLDSGIYAKVPSSKELIGVISAKGNLATQVEACKKFVCGAVQVAADQGCLWWEIDSKVYAQSKDLVGNLKTATGGSVAREVKTILLISPETLDTLEFIDSIEVVCHQDTRPDSMQPVSFSRVG